MRLPTYVFVVDQDRHAFKLVVSRSRDSYYYGPCLLADWRNSRETWRSLKPTESMVRIGQGRYLVTHACVDACHCPHCGSDVGVLCRTTLRNGCGKLTTSTHYRRRDLYRQALNKQVC